MGVTDREEEHSSPRDAQCSGPGAEEDLLHALLAHLPTAALGVRAGTVIYANEAALRSLEAAEPADVLGRALVDLSIPEYAAALCEALQGGVSHVRMEAALTTLGGSRLDVLVEAERLREGGEPLFALTLRDASGRRRAQQALRDSEERYRRLVELSPDAILVYAQGRIRYANSAAARLFGVPDAAALDGREVLDFVHPDYRDLVAEHIRQVGRAVPMITDIVARLQGAAGDRMVWVEVAASSITLDERAGVQVVLHDITDRLQAESALRHSEERYRALVESSPDAIYVQVEGVIVYANPAAATLLGVPGPQDLIGRHVVDHVHPEYRDLVQHRIRQAVAHGSLEPRVLERLRSYDGRDLYVQIQGAFVTYGLERGVQVVLRDVSDQVQMEEELRRQRELYAQIVESSPEPALVVGAGVVRYANISALHLLGLRNAEQIPGTLFMDRIEAEAYAQVSSALESAYHGDLSPLTETRVLRPDGASVDVAIRVTPMPYQTERIAQVTLYDLTERKRTEAALLRREAILSAVGYAAEQFLRVERWQDCIDEVLARLGDAADASRVYLYQTDAPLAERVDVRLQGLWSSPDGDATGILPLPQSVQVEPGRLQEWREALAKGETVQGVTRSFPGPDRESLARMGTRSMLLVPVTVDDAMWGVIGCDDGREERVWHSVERDALRSVAGILGASMRRQNAAEALRDAEQRLREVLDQSRDIAYRIDARRMRFDYVSRAAGELEGLYDADTLDADPADLFHSVHPDDRDEFVRGFEGLLDATTDADRPAPAEYRWRLRDGTYRWYSDNRSLVRDERGRAVALVGSVRDITDQVNARSALEQSEERFRSVFEGTQDAIVLQDRSHRVLYVNHAALRWLNAAPEQVVGRIPDAAVVGPVDRARWSEAIDRVLRTHRQELTADSFHVGQQVSFAETSRIPLVDGGGDVYAVATLLHDVTERHLAEVALKESEARARGLFENIGDAFWLLDTGMQVVDSNAAAADLLGRASSDLLGLRAGVLAELLAVPAQALEHLIGEARDKGSPIHLAGAEARRVELGADRAVYLDLLAYRVRVSGEPRVALLARDVTAARQLDAALQRSRQLEAVGRLSAGVAHDFGNLLSIIQGECELLAVRLADDSEALQELRAIETVVGSGTSVTRELMAFSMGEKVEREILHLGLVVRRNEVVLRRMVGTGVRLELDLDPGPLYVWGEAGQLNRVLINLAMNARDAMPDGGVLRITTRSATTPPEGAQHPGLAAGPYAVLTVSDTGRGIAEEDLSNVFEPFYTTRGGQGRHGLGLSVVYGIVTQSGGDVTVDSRQGQGTTFTVVLPAVSGEAEEDDLS